jgi:hypothetical protein
MTAQGFLERFRAPRRRRHRIRPICFLARSGCDIPFRSATSQTEQTVCIERVRDAETGPHAKESMYDRQNPSRFDIGCLEGRFLSVPGAEVNVEWNR